MLAQRRSDFRRTQSEDGILSLQKPAKGIDQELLLNDASRRSPCDGFATTVFVGCWCHRKYGSSLSQKLLKSAFLERRQPQQCAEPAKVHPVKANDDGQRSDAVHGLPLPGSRFSIKSALVTTRSVSSKRADIFRDVICYARNCKKRYLASEINYPCRCATRKTERCETTFIISSGALLVPNFI